MKKLLLMCILALGSATFAQVGPPQATNPNTNNGYGFAQSSGTYTTLDASRTVWQSGAALATNAASSAISLPAPFKFNGKLYSSIFISNNGFITFGSAPLATTTSTGLSINSASPNIAEGAIAGFSNDLINANTTTSEISYQSVGTKFIVQFTDLKNTSGSASQLLNFQIQLDTSNNTVAIVYGNCVSGTATTTGQVGLRGAESSDINNRTGTNWSTTAIGTSTTSTCTLGTANSATVPASGLTFTYTPGTWLSNPATYATIPFTENFSSWVNGNSTGDLPNATYWRTWPSRGDNSWRANNHATTVGFTTSSGWTDVSESTTTAIAAPAVAPTARFHTYQTSSGYSGYMDLYVDLSTGGTGNRVISFDYRNQSGTDKLDVLLSTDGGVTFSNLGSSLTTATSWTNKSFTTTSTASNAIIRFLATSDFGSDDIFFDNLSITVSALPPACTTISSPINAGTAVSVTPTITWAASTGATSYVINLGTTPGGTNVMNGVDVGNVTTYSIPAGTPLSYNQQYYITILPKNTYGTANGCTETNFTTSSVPCPAVTAPSAGATGVILTPTISWTAVTGASGYKLSVGTTTGGTDVLNAQDLGNVTSYTFGSPLNAQTKYYYTVNAYQGVNSSVSCTERNFTTQCNPIATLPWTENFDGMTTLGLSVIPSCWANTGSWTSAAAAGNTYNDPKSAPNYMTIYYPTTAAYLWTPSFTLTAGQSYDFSFYWVGDGLTGWQNEVLVNNTQSSTGATSLSTFITPTQTATGGSNSTNYTKTKVTFVPTTTGNYTFGIKAFVTTTAPYYFGVDDFNLMLTPSCSEPVAVTVPAANINPLSADITWTAPATAPANGYDIYYSTTNTAPTAATVPSLTSTSTSTTLNGLTPSTTYYVWVRSNCSTADQSIWVSASFTTKTFCPTVTAPAAGEIGVSTTPTITWTAVNGATGYKLSVGTTAGGTDVLNNVDLGNVISYTFATSLSGNTKYYYTLNAYNSTVASSSCTERNFTTMCTASVPTYTNDFASGAGTCTSIVSGGSPTGSASTGTTAYWFADGFLNNGTTGAMKINLYSLNRAGWLKMAPLNLSGGGYKVKFDYGATNYAATTAVTAMGSDDKVQFVVSQDGGSTWTVLQTWDNSNIPSNTSTTYTLDLTGYTSANTIFAFYGTDGAVDDTPDYEFFVDNFVVEPLVVLATNEVKDSKNNVKVYPNPFSEVLNISDAANVKNVLVTDVAGRLVKTITNPASQLQLRELKEGLYLVTLEMKDGSKQTFKTIKR